MTSAGARSTLTKMPSNVVVEAGRNVTLECSSNASASSIRWNYDGAGVTGSGCTSSWSHYVTKSTGNNCDLTVLGSYSVQGPYACSDGSVKTTAQAVVIVIGNFESIRVVVVVTITLLLQLRYGDVTFTAIRSVC